MSADRAPTARLTRRQRFELERLSVRHLARYLDEFAFRWTHKAEKDEDRTLRAILQGDGVRLMFRPPKRRPPAGMAPAL